MKSTFFILAFAMIFSSTLSYATPVCVGNSTGGVFCYEPLPPIDTTLPPLSWFVVAGGPTLPGQSIGLADQLKDDLARLESGEATDAIVKEVKGGQIHLYAQLIALKQMEATIKKLCTADPSGASKKGWDGTCKGSSKRMAILNPTISGTGDAISKLSAKNVNLDAVRFQIKKNKKGLSQYSKMFISDASEK